jgi:hypothetical protein
MKLIDTRAMDGKQKTKKSDAFISEKQLFEFFKTVIDDNPDLAGSKYFKPQKTKEAKKNTEE